MCGIFGFVGKNGQLSELINGLKKLEYRGYDSAGIAYLDQEKIQIAKRSGRVAFLEEAYRDRLIKPIQAGIAHTRWATHGSPTDTNAHPHTDCHHRIAVVHNGIIENFPFLKKNLMELGHRFVSDTDTEVIAHLVEENYQGNLLEAVRNTLQALRGAYALCVLHSDHPTMMIAAKSGSPLVVGQAQSRWIVASDATPILGYSKDLFFMEDGEVVQIKDGKGFFFDDRGNQIEKDKVFISWEETAAEKGGYTFFMEKEIAEEPHVLRSSSASRIVVSEDGKKRVAFDELEPWVPWLRTVKELQIIAAGTSFHAGLVMKYFMNAISPLKIHVDIASEYRYMKIVPDRQTLYIAISQSGETLDTLEAIRYVKSLGGKTLTLTNVLGSSISREADQTIFLHAGPEIGVASTKAYVAQLMVLSILGLYLVQCQKGSVDESLINPLIEIPTLFQKAIAQSEEIQKIARAYAKDLHFMFIGRGIHYPTAMEGALKLKEISYINASSYAAGELKHGPIALLDEDFPVFAIAPEDPLFPKMVSNILETKARGSRVICLTTEGIQTNESFADSVIFMPETHPLYYPLLCAPYVQLFAFHVANIRGLDVDKPRNLAKSVTVE